ncbi:hypothetical protein N9P66_01270 [Salibacteraceae bacterium]|nr:hypothetical protein [Salibacteraceae bacterium]
MKLTVQNYSNDKYRLGITSSDSIKYFKCRGVKVIVWLSKTNKVEVNTTCDTPTDDKGVQNKGFTEGYNLNHEEIDNWIKLKGFDKYSPNEPKEIQFSFKERKNGDIVLVYPWDNLTTRFNPFNVTHRRKYE